MANADMSLFQRAMNAPTISRLRRNHGLEHATMNILSQRFPGVRMAGHSDLRGFWVVGDVSIEEVRDAIEEALRRMRAGEYNLAVHQYCGTNFVVAGVLAGLAAGISMFGVGRRFRDKIERLPLAMTLATLAMILGMPLGLKLQEYVTTSAHPGGLRVVEITTKRRGLNGSRIKAHRIATRGG